MATQDNEGVVRELYKIFDTKDFDRLSALTVENAQWTDVPFGYTGSVRESLESWAKAFPDGKVQVQHLFSQGDYVLAEITGRGTHTGPLKGPAGEIPPTGRKLELRMAEIYFFKNGKIYEGRSYFDAATILQQLGIEAPLPGAEVRKPTTQPRH